MSVAIKVSLTCDGCGIGYETELFDSVAEARQHAWDIGKWATLRVFNRVLEFCGKCQAHGKELDQKAADEPRTKTASP